MTTSPPISSDVLEQAITEARAVAEFRQQETDIGPFDRWSSLVVGGAFAVIAIGLVATSGAPTRDQLITLVLLVVAHALASRVVFESAGGAAVPTEPTLVVGMLLLRVEYLPLMVLASLLLSIRRRPSVHDVLVRSMSGWHCIGPVLVLGVADLDQVSLDHWPVYALAVAAQFVFDAAIALIRCAALGLSWTVLPRPMSWTWSVDALLAPIGLAAVFAADGSRWALVFAACPIGVLALLGRDRTEHFEKAVVISEAFEEAVEVARRDPVAGIANRRAWNEATAGAALRYAADPVGHSVTVVLADVDGLKQVNDTLGHDAGDDLIRAAAEVLQEAAPDGALVARVGGDEFGVLVVDHPSLTCDQIVERIRWAIAAHPPVRGLTLSLSVGGAACPPHPDVEAAQVAADEHAIADKAARKAGR